VHPLGQARNENPGPSVDVSPLQHISKVLPLLVALVYISVPAGVVVYFVASSLIRILRHAFMYRWDSQIRTSLERLRDRFGSRETQDPAMVSSRGQPAARRM
jgi:membrane protein insertase Oxa1/YidC/SpoIIIJ